MGVDHRFGGHVEPRLGREDGKSSSRTGGDRSRGPGGPLGRWVGRRGR